MKVCIGMDQIAGINYEHVKLCFVLVPLGGKIILEPRPQNKTLVPFRVFFLNIQRASQSLLYGSPPGDPSPSPAPTRFAL